MKETIPYTGGAEDFMRCMSTSEMKLVQNHEPQPLPAYLRTGLGCQFCVIKLVQWPIKNSPKPNQKYHIDHIPNIKTTRGKV